MKKTTKYILMSVSALAVLGGSYFIYNKVKGDGDNGISDTDTNTNVDQEPKSNIREKGGDTKAKFDEYLLKIQPKIDSYINNPNVSLYRRNSTIGGLGTDIHAFNEIHKGSGYKLVVVSKNPYKVEIQKES